ncbi:hypothetical protein COO60DRAFT_530732 [Scenedesmus sp. NREL 46B-D3]|nr:hypothetical protein COO60DRAFT_530732 [Scenedesmus sp. NREL 46B-D3]
MAWQLTHTARTKFPFVKGGNERRSCTPALLQQQQWQHRVPAAAAASGNGSEGPLSFEDDADSGLSKLRYNKRPSELPKELQDLEISEEGDLIDRKTGKVINEFGATRFDVAVRALRGELDPAPWVENSERNPGVLMSKLINFPTAYTFQVVGKPTADTSKNDFVQDMVATICRVCQAEVQQDDITVKVM